MTQNVYVSMDGAEEELRAQHISGSNYVVTSIPFVSTDFALGDVVECVDHDRRLMITTTVLRGGNSTLRILPRGVDVISPLINLDLHVEEGPAGVVAVCLGPDAPIHGLLSWLEGLEEDGVIDLSWGFRAAEF